MPAAGLAVVENCVTCTLKAERFFCNLTESALEDFERFTFTSLYPTGSVLFREGESPRGIFMLCSGTAKLSVSSVDGKTLITRVAARGEVLGLSSNLTGRPHAATVELAEPAHIKFMKRDDFVRFLAEHGDACMQASQQLSLECEQATDHIRALGLSQSAGEKLAHLILTWANERGKPAAQGIRISVTETHASIAQQLGTSRETVTRALAELKKNNIVSMKGSTLTVLKKSALEEMVRL